jgi:hypothetical protein
MFVGVPTNIGFGSFSFSSSVPPCCAASGASASPVTTAIAIPAPIQFLFTMIPALLETRRAPFAGESRRLSKARRKAPAFSL